MQRSGKGWKNLCLEQERSQEALMSDDPAAEVQQGGLWVQFLGLQAIF